MRLINADAVKDIINNIQWDKYEGMPRLVFWADLHEQIDILPTIDPVKHGRWVKEEDRHMHWHCSECSYVIGAMVMDSNYCPNCGARMDGDDIEID